MGNERFWTLLSAKLAGEASADDLRELEVLIAAHPEWQYAIQNLEDIWKHQPDNNTSAEEDAWLLLRNRMTDENIPFGTEEPRHRGLFVIRRYWYYAAALVAVFGTVIFYFLLNPEPPEIRGLNESNEISTRRGSKSRVQLPDGTIVLLNAGSKLSYNKNFGMFKREVSLSGEGYFDVKKLPGKPFIIHTSTINIKVLGTVFNVRAYPEDKLTETSLIHGSIEVTMKNRPNDIIILSPSEKLVLENENILSHISSSKRKTALPEPEDSADVLMIVKKISYNRTDSAVLEIQWVDNKLVFRDESFENLALQMERWYDVDININGAALKQKRFSGIFEQETITDALEALRLTVPFRYEQDQNKFIIHN